MSRHLNEIDKALIKEDLNNGLSCNHVATKRGFARSTIQKYCNLFKSEIPTSRKYGSGRISKITFDMKIYIKSLYESNSFITSLEISKKIEEKFNIKISRPTVSRTLKNFGLLTKIAVKKPLLKPINIVKRFKISENFLGMKNETLKRIIFTDETKFNLFNSDGAQYVRYYPGKRYDMKNTIGTVKHNGGCIMVWGSISYQGTERLVFIANTMIGAAYKQIFAQNLRQSAIEMGLDDLSYSKIIITNTHLM